MSQASQLTSVRPLVRYVDQEQAVIDVQLQALGLEGPVDGRPAVRDIWTALRTHEGFYDEQTHRVTFEGGWGKLRLEIVEPARWWPANMGEQHLYELELCLLQRDEPVHHRSITLGLASVRSKEGQRGRDDGVLLVNGQLCDIRSIITVDRVDQSQLLPAGAGSILLVRDHYGHELLYQAADRAGILLIQSVPLHPEARPEVEMAAQIDRLAAHPSLAGWFVGHLGRLSDQITRTIRRLDPTHHVFRRMPTSHLHN